MSEIKKKILFCLSMFCVSVLVFACLWLKWEKRIQKMGNIENSSIFNDSSKPRDMESLTEQIKIHWQEIRELNNSLKDLKPEDGKEE